MQDQDPEDELRERASQGDLKAIEDLFVKYAPPIRGHIRKNIPARHQAVLSDDDVMQEAYIRIHSHLRGSERGTVSNFSGLLYRVADNLLHTMIRKLDAIKRGGEESFDSFETAIKSLYSQVGTPSGELRVREAEAALEDGLAQLPEHYRIVIKRRFWDLKSPSDIAEELGIGRTAIYGRLDAAMDWLREIMGGMSRYF